jgi:hypothetical protein
MDEYLFRESLSALADAKIREVRTQTEQLTTEQLQAPDLASALETIATLKFEVATLKPDQRRGKRRTERQKITDYGREIFVDVDFVEVSIPFVGWPKSLRLAPSYCKIVDTPAKITSNTVDVTFRDDQNLDRNVDVFIQIVSENLATLQRELTKLQPQMLQTAQIVANQRIQQIRERKERDKTRSFPIE